MGKAHDVPSGSAPPVQPEQHRQSQPGWAAELNAGAKAESSGDVPLPTVPAPTAAAAVVPAASVAPEAEEIQSPVPEAILTPEATDDLPVLEDAVPVNPPAQSEKVVCVTNGCKSKQKLRGLCARCHKSASAWIDDRERFPSKDAGWLWLEQNGHSLPSGNVPGDKFLHAINTTLAKQVGRTP